MNRLKILSIAFASCFILFCASCEDDDDNDTTIQDIDCILLTDINGQSIGTSNNCDVNNQWSFQELSATELSYLSRDFGTRDFSNPPLFNGAAAFPNPVAVDQPFVLSFFSDSTEFFTFQIAIVDQDGNIIFQNVAETIGSVQVQIDTGSLEVGSFYRIYYQFYLEDQDVIAFEGFGNILVCESSPVFDIEADCL